MGGLFVIEYEKSEGNLPMDAVWEGNGGKRPHYYSFAFCKAKEKSGKKKTGLGGG